MANGYNLRGEVENTQKQVSQINTYLIGITVVTVFGFISLMFTVVSLVISYQHDNAQSYRDYRDELRLQNDKIDNLQDAVEKKQTIIQQTN